MRGAAGFTILEMMAVITILAILAAVALPGFGYLAASTKVKGASTELYLAMIRGRAEAVKRNRSVVIKATSGSATNWNAGWQVIADANNDGDFSDVGAGDDRLIYEQGDLRRVSITMGANQVVFRPTGRISSPAVVEFSVTSEDQDKKVNLLRCVETDLTGRPYVKQAAC